MGRLRHYNFSSPRAYSYKISCYALEKNFYKVFYTSLPWLVLTVCCRRLPLQTSLWPAETLINLAWCSARPVYLTRSVKSSSAACGIEDILAWYSEALRPPPHLHKHQLLLLSVHCNHPSVLWSKNIYLTWTKQSWHNKINFSPLVTNSSKQILLRTCVIRSPGECKKEF